MTGQHLVDPLLADQIYSRGARLAGNLFTFYRPLTPAESAVTSVLIFKNAHCSRARLVWRRSLAIFAALLLSSGTLFVSPAVAEESAAKVEFFEAKIRPLLIRHCTECHGETLSENGLRLDSRAAALKGGQRGPALVPGDASGSLLVRVVGHDEEDLAMPPEGDRLEEQVIAALTQWINDGAVWPANLEALASASPVERMDEFQATHWAFQPIKQPTPPEVNYADWIRNDIDRFVLVRLEAAGLAPSDRANRRTLIRRAYFDLLGIPPTYEEVEKFVSDPSSDAYERLVERLLARPEYGQRWGRHWLDIARYSDTKGYVKAGNYDPRYAFAWTYRDYVIRAFNEDLPYDQFILQQLAADKLDLPAVDRWNLAAMGFMTVGRRFFNRRHHIIPERVDLVSRGLLGMTMMCAQCHDHKFDPLSMKDYYALYGVLDSSEEPGLAEMPLLGPPLRSEGIDYDAFNEKFNAELEKYEAKRGEIRTAASHELRAFAGDYLEFLSYTLPGSKKPETPFATERTKLRLETATIVGGTGRWLEYVNAHHKDPVFVLWHKLAELPVDKFAEQAPEVIAKTKMANRLVREKLIETPPQQMADVARAIGMSLEEVYARWKKLQEIDPGDEGFADPAAEQLRLVLYGEDSPAIVASDEEAVSLYLPDEAKAIKEIHDALEAIVVKYIDVAPPRAMTLVDGPNPHDGRVFIRGDHQRLGEVAPRRFLEVLQAAQGEAPLTEGSGRLQLARAIVDPDNPLTSRVMINRIWGWHFGQHLVGTPSDFGSRGKPPTHPELLDYLSHRFIDGGWSMKSMHRLIMNSATYCQRSENRTDCADLDPLNELLWRMNRRRLEFEPMRDAMLAVSGELDTRVGGLPFRDVDTPRRSVYYYINRRRIDAVLPTFDVVVPEATLPKRDQTTVPQQALYLMNSGFAMRRARTLVDRLETLSGPESTDDRVTQLYRWIYGRDPSAEEAEIGIAFVDAGAVDAPESLSIGEMETSWHYGFGEFDAEAGHVVSFTEFSHFDGRRWQEGEHSSDMDRQTAFVSADTGRPGRDAKHSWIRRWTAPEGAAGLYLVKGRLVPSKMADVGDGFDIYIVSSRDGVIKHFPYEGDTDRVEVRAEKIKVEVGDSIDLVVVSRENNQFDDFTWSPIVYEIGMNSDGGLFGIKPWLGAEAFNRSVPQWAGAMDPWQQFAQVLLITNEFMFVD